MKNKNTDLLTNLLGRLGSEIVEFMEQHDIRDDLNIEEDLTIYNFLAYTALRLKGIDVKEDKLIEEPKKLITRTQKILNPFLDNNIQLKIFFECVVKMVYEEYKKHSPILS